VTLVFSGAGGGTSYAYFLVEIGAQKRSDNSRLICFVVDQNLYVHNNPLARKYHTFVINLSIAEMGH
jgi:hypothetical protein